jgi:hypothetical protein
MLSSRGRKTEARKSAAAEEPRNDELAVWDVSGVEQLSLHALNYQLNTTDVLRELGVNLGYPDSSSLGHDRQLGKITVLCKKKYLDSSLRGSLGSCRANTNVGDIRGVIFGLTPATLGTNVSEWPEAGQIGGILSVAGRQPTSTTAQGEVQSNRKEVVGNIGSDI